MEPASFLLKPRSSIPRMYKLGSAYISFALKQLCLFLSNMTGFLSQNACRKMQMAKNGSVFRNFQIYQIVCIDLLDHIFFGQLWPKILIFLGQIVQAKAT